MHGFESLLSLATETLLSQPGHRVSLWLLSIIFAISGTAKVRKPARAALAIVNFGLTARPRVALGLMLGLSELALALTLGLTAIRVITVPVASVSAAILLGIFVLLIARSLRRGDRFECFCLGEARTELSKMSLIRAFVLMILAFIPAASQGASPGPVKLEESMLELEAAAAVFALSMLITHIPTLVRTNRAGFRPSGP